MANDVINPEEMSSEQYGEALLQRKFSRAREYEKRERKDRRKDLAWKLLGGIDQLMVGRAAAEVAERDRNLDFIIARETGEFNNLENEYEAQAPWRAASSPEAYALKLARDELTGTFSEKEWLSLIHI